MKLLLRELQNTAIVLLLQMHKWKFVFWRWLLKICMQFSFTDKTKNWLLGIRNYVPLLLFQAFYHFPFLFVILIIYFIVFFYLNRTEKKK